ncbi:MAG: hypothetical protein ACE5RJ_02640 [Nitrosopumilaceae archaeon]
MLFTTITQELQRELKSNLAQIRFLLKKNPALGYTKMNEISRVVGQKFGLKLILNFPKQGKIEESEYYGKRDLSIIVDLQKKNFPIDRSIIKSKAQEVFVNAEAVDAYMYEDKEGVRVLFEGGRIDVLPHSLHIWCEFEDDVTKFCDWLLENVYQLKPSN